MSKSQCQQILEHLKKRGSITGLEALQRYGCIHLPRRIKDLKESGHKIGKATVEVMKTDGSIARVADYFLLREGKE